MYCSHSKPRYDGAMVKGRRQAPRSVNALLCPLAPHWQQRQRVVFAQLAFGMRISDRGGSGGGWRVIPEPEVLRGRRETVGVKMFHVLAAAKQNHKTASACTYPQPKSHRQRPAHHNDGE